MIINIIINVTAHIEYIHSERWDGPCVRDSDRVASTKTSAILNPKGGIATRMLADLTQPRLQMYCVIDYSKIA